MATLPYEPSELKVLASVQSRALCASHEHVYKFGQTRPFLPEESTDQRQSEKAPRPYAKYRGPDAKFRLASWIYNVKYHMRASITRDK